MQPDAQLSQASVVSRWWHAVIAAVIALGLIIQLALIFTGGADANSGETGASASILVRLWRLFSFFTIESNLIVLAVCIALVINPIHDGRFWRVARLDSLLGIVITGLVFAIVLAPLLHLTGAAEVATVCFHYISPWATLLGWLLFGPRPQMSWNTVAAAFIWPTLWLIYIFTQGAFTNWYPYPFLNAANLGLGAAVRNAVLVLLVGVVLAVLIKMADAKLPMPWAATRPEVRI